MKLNILLIDDNPFCKLEKVVKKNDKWRRKVISKVFDCTDEEIDQITPDYLSFPILDLGAELKYNEFWDLIELKWLQSTGAIKEYFDRINELEHNLNSLEELKSKIFVPDIVVFDYALTGKEGSSGSLPKSYSLDFIRKTLDPTLDFDSGFDNTNYKWNGTLNSDRYGLFSGGLIVERFKRNKPCFGVPATYWESSKLEGTEAGYFEWMLGNSFKGVFDGEGLKGVTEKNKKWQPIIDTSIFHFRNEILDYLKNNKISIDLNNIISLLDCFSSKTEIEKLESKILRFKSVYGWRELPLNGLFIDCKVERNWDSNEKSEKVDEFDEGITQIEKKIRSVNRSRKPNKDKLLSELQERKEKLGNEKRVFNSLSERQFIIWEFLYDVYKAVGTTHKEIKEAIRISDKLWGGFKKFAEPRLELAYLTRVEFTDKVEIKYKEDRLKELYDMFGIKDPASGIPEQYRISIVDEIGKTDIQTIRLTIGHLITEAYYALASTEATSKGTASRELGGYEIYCLLCPVDNAIRTAESLLFHPLDSPPANGVLESYIKTPIAGKINAPKNKTFFEFEWFSGTEKMVIKSLFPDKSTYPKFLN